MKVAEPSRKQETAPGPWRMNPSSGAAFPPQNGIFWGGLRFILASPSRDSGLWHPRDALEQSPECYQRLHPRLCCSKRAFFHSLLYFCCSWRFFFIRFWCFGYSRRVFSTLFWWFCCSVRVFSTLFWCFCCSRRVFSTLFWCFCCSVRVFFRSLLVFLLLPVPFLMDKWDYSWVLGMEAGEAAAGAGSELDFFARFCSVLPGFAGFCRVLPGRSCSSSSPQETQSFVSSSAIFFFVLFFFWGAISSSAFSPGQGWANFLPFPASSTASCGVSNLPRDIFAVENRVFFAGIRCVWTLGSSPCGGFRVWVHPLPGFAALAWVFGVDFGCFSCRKRGFFFFFPRGLGGSTG